MVISSQLESRSQCSRCPNFEPWRDSKWSSQSREKSDTRVIFHKCSRFLPLVPQGITNGIISGVRTFGFCVPFLFACEAMSLGWVERSVMKTAFSIQLPGERVRSQGRLGKRLSHHQHSCEKNLTPPEIIPEEGDCDGGGGSWPEDPGCRTVVIFPTDFTYTSWIENQRYKVYVIYSHI